MLHDMQKSNGNVTGTYSVRDKVGLKKVNWMDV